jgi:hypothetical protein
MELSAVMVLRSNGGLSRAVTRGGLLTVTPDGRPVTVSVARSGL